MPVRAMNCHDTTVLDMKRLCGSLVLVSHPDPLEERARSKRGARKKNCDYPIQFLPCCRNSWSDARSAFESQETIDLAGRRVRPGLNDSPLHVIRGGQNLN